MHNYFITTPTSDQNTLSVNVEEFMRMALSKRIRLNVVLLKNSIKFGQPDTFIEDYSTDNEINFDKGSLKAILYKRVGAKKQPDWVKDLKNKVLGQGFSGNFPNSQTSGATLFLSIKNRIFAINFGTLGRFNIKKNVIDKTFGIYTANKLLNDNENIKIKGAHSRVNETNPINKQRQYGENISNNQLFLSLEDNEALRELAVINSESKEFYRLIGKYSSLNIQFIFEDAEVPCLQYLPSRLEKLLNIYASVTKEDIKQLSKGLYPVDDEKAGLLTAQLSTHLVRSPDNFFLFEAEIDFDLSLVSGFKINTSNGGAIYNELSLADYLQLISSPQGEDLENDSIQVLDEDSNAIKDWSIFDCLYGEIQYDNQNYILSYGIWYEISNDKYDRITSKINQITNETFEVAGSVKQKAKEDIDTFIQQNPGKKVNKENIFNRAFCDHLNGQLFDEAVKQITINEDKFEVCDILIPSEKRFLHVKNNSGASALSHLFNQGFVSAKSYAEFKSDYANAVNTHISDGGQHIAIELEGSCIHYLIINPKTENKLTFFSKMVLEDKIRTLEAMRFKVYLSWVRGVY